MLPSLIINKVNSSLHTI